MADHPTDPDALVREFCAAWKTLDVDEVMSYFADDAVYHNIPLEPAEGRDAIRGVLEMMAGMSPGIDFAIHRQVVDGNLVMNERTDTMTMGDKTVALPVMGTFEIEDGKIKAWRDYFDMGQFTGA
ncbi:MAG: limonene-1,2-epoxide hydrolase family protein [Acidimicrobiia bacterium]